MGQAMNDATTEHEGPVSASRLAELMGDKLPPLESIPAEAFELTAAVRELVEAVVLSDLPVEGLTDATERVRALTADLRRHQRAEALDVRGIGGARRAGIEDEADQPGAAFDHGVDRIRSSQPADFCQDRHRITRARRPCGDRRWPAHLPGR